MLSQQELAEHERIKALRALDILDTPAEERFDRFTRIATSALDMPISLVSLIDRNRQWFKSQVGLDLCETPRCLAFCSHAIALDEMLVGGLQTDLGFHRWLVDDPGFVAGAYDTGFVATQWRDGPVLRPEDVALVGLAAREARSAGSARGASAGQTPRPVLVSDPRRPGDAAWARLGRQEGLRR